MKKFKLAAAILAATTLVAVPSFAQRGSADFTRYVALGDSYGVGLSNGSMNERHQQFSYPAVIARQAGAPDWVQPLVSYPGIGPELRIINITSFPPVIQPEPTQGVPLNLTFPRPYNNLSIPGANVADLTTLTGANQNPTRTPESFARFILRGQGTAVQQALALHPTFITVWIGGNDYLGAALGGNPALMTPVDAFRTSYTTLLDSLIAGAPAAGIVVGSLPSSTNLPAFTTVQPVIINPATRQPLLINGAVVPLVAELSPGVFGQLPAGSRVLLTAAGMVGTGYGIPPQLATQPPFNALPDAGKPLPNSAVLTPTEIEAITTRVGEYNTVINQLAQARNIPVADVQGLFNRVGSATPYFVGPIQVGPSYITGGFYGLDGFHLTDLGYILFANEYIRAINAAYDKEIPFASITQLFANNGAMFPDASTANAVTSNISSSLSSEAASQMRAFATRPTLRFVAGTTTESNTSADAPVAASRGNQ